MCTRVLAPASYTLDTAHQLTRPSLGRGLQASTALSLTWGLALGPPASSRQLPTMVAPKPAD